MQARATQQDLKTWERALRDLPEDDRRAAAFERNYGALLADRQRYVAISRSLLVRYAGTAVAVDDVISDAMIQTALALTDDPKAPAEAMYRTIAGRRAASVARRPATRRETSWDAGLEDGRLLNVCDPTDGIERVLVDAVTDGERNAEVRRMAARLREPGVLTTNQLRGAQALADAGGDLGTAAAKLGKKPGAVSEMASAARKRLAENEPELVASMRELLNLRA